MEYLAKLHTTAACPILAITGLAERILRQDAIMAGAREFLEKPIRTKQLREVVMRLLLPES